MDAKTKYKSKKIKIIFFDIDDTLRQKTTGYLPSSVNEAVRQLKAKGYQIGIASGRNLLGFLPEIMALAPDYLVTLNGAYVEDSKGQVIFAQALSDELVSAYKAWTREVGIDYGLVSSHTAGLSYRNDMISQAIDPIYEGLPTLPELDQEATIYQMWTFEAQGDALQLPAALAQDLRLVRWHPHSSDVVLRGTSKALGVAKVVEKLGLKPENVLVFGDGLNDLELFDYAGLKIAMGQSHLELQAKADYITKNLEEDGIFYALEELGMVETPKTYPQLDVTNYDGPIATIKTNHGDLKIKLFPEIAPKTVANFIALAKDGYYDGVIFHRIIKDFMIQGGDPTGTGMGGESIYGARFEDEFSMEAFNVRGALSMANAGPNTNGSQFFIVQNTNFPYSQKELERGGWPAEIAAYYAAHGGTPHLDNRHTVFGQLMDDASYEVLDAIAGVKTGAQDRPVDDVKMLTVEIED